MSTLRIEWPCNKRDQLQKSEERGKVASTNLIRYQNKDCTFADCKVKGNCFCWQGIDKVLVRLRGRYFFDPDPIFLTPYLFFQPQPSTWS